MSGNEDETDDDVTISIEIEGAYENVVPKLQQSGTEPDYTESLTDDVSTVLETLVRMDGGTRSAVADRLPDDMAVSYDAQAVVDLLPVLERYDLVVLEGNTWYPGPVLQQGSVE